MQRLDMGTHWLVVQLVPKDLPQPVGEPPEEQAMEVHPTRPEWAERCLSLFREWGYTENDMSLLASEGLDPLPVEGWVEDTRKRLTEFYTQARGMSQVDRHKYIGKLIREGDK